MHEETWVLDKELSTITFEITSISNVKNVTGRIYRILKVLVEIDVEKKENNKGVFTVEH